MEGMNIIKRPRLKKPNLILAWPGMGDVAFKAAVYLVEQLKAEEFAQLSPEEFFYLTASVADKGIISLPDLPSGRFYFWKNKTGSNDLIIFIGDSQPDLTKAEEYSRRIIKLAKSFKVNLVINLASIPQPIEHTQEPRVWFAATSDVLRGKLKDNKLKPLSDGYISGMNGLFLGIAKAAGFEGFCLLGEIPLYTIQIENPKASAAILSVLNKYLGINLNLSELLEQGRIIEEEINRLLDYLKLGPQQGQSNPPIGEEEIERIKKTLSQFTRLPASVKDKIEKLFNEVNLDITKANELKTELDKWNVYKEYEDRFLDLFRKRKEKDN